MRYLASLVILLVSAGWCGAAYIYEHKGLVEYRNSDKDNWERVPSGGRFTVAPGMQLRTARASMAEIHMDDGSRVKVAPRSNFTLSAEDKQKSVFGLTAGRMRSWVKKFSRRFEVRTPSAVCAVRGTDYTTSVDGQGNTSVEVSEGSVLVGDAAGRTALVREGEMTQVQMGGGVQEPQVNPDPPSGDDASLAGARELARKEIYTEISKDAVIAQAQAEMQSSEYQNRKVAIDAYGNRVRMEEYVIRPQADQFKYVVLNTREDRFDFGKILFTFNQALPGDLSRATANMTSYAGSSAPEWYLTEMNSVMSNTLDKVTEDASGGRMIADNAASPSEWSLFFTNYAVYAAGPDQANENGGLGRMLWSYSDGNMDGVAQSGEFAYLGGSAPSASVTYPAGLDTFHTITRNTYSDSTWIEAEDFVLFDDGKIAETGDFAQRLGASMSSVSDRLNFERVYTSSLFGGRKIDLEFSAKLLKDAGLIRLP